MTRFNLRDELPLQYATPKSWAERVLQNPLELLYDHAYLERKAATNALDLLNRWVEPACPHQWVQTLSHLAQDETSHLYIVSQLIARRSGTLPRTHRNLYARDLRSAVRTGQGRNEVLDRLLVAALIEARSCERFWLLAEVATDKDLQQLYRNLFASEAGHFKTFLKLAEMIADSESVQNRWQELLRLEAELIQAQPVQPTLHSGV
ncbi:MAG: tRNA-(ms[2]io[6]A)-hydroxylase [Chloroherpetonaceae bacterium]|nr:tRNA-(ms[2]io[6]A)-hydroxylase [Chloroherpetonaceae bacterium]MCS7210113.1 tRNA-(ms[2]io[6]A)-hydroxylase [Chloroherpetonaceae bacterium]MDW8020565.1 tRNA-(ms[2]io[6]A)-hydroxylase [Chloroherpetonaceae bacterium]MDW8467402.1 tRNA-(ms[2]io[6]A)-hydroxylase [Chloroherpetonaceae bacterium]